MRIAILGTGAMACFVASRLCDSADVLLIGSWRDQIATIERDGLWVEQLDGEETHHRPKITAELERVTGADLLLFLVKSYQTEEVVARSQKWVSAETRIITLQNGLGNWERLVAVWGAERVTAGVATLGVTGRGLGRVRHAGRGEVVIGRFVREDEILNAFVARGGSADFPLRLAGDVRALLWGKVAINAAINPLTAFYGVKNGALLDQESWREGMRETAREVQRVAEAQGIALPFADAGLQAEEVARKTADNFSSMLQDRMKGRPLELEAICGEVVRAGARWHVPTPYNAQWYHLLSADHSADLR